MKLLKIENNQGLYLGIYGEYNPLDAITKDDLLRLAGLALEKDVVFDDFSKENLHNEAHQIIYKSVHEKLKHLSETKVAFKDECKQQYLAAYEKYCDNNKS